jgi:hypothetical protein
MIKFVMILFVFMFGCAAQVQSVPSKVEVAKPAVKVEVPSVVEVVPVVVESPPEVIVVECADVNINCADVKGENRHNKAACLLGLKNNIDCKMMDNDNKLIITFKQFGQGKIECVKKALNSPAVKKALTKLYSGGIFFYSSSDRQIEMGVQ